MYGSLLRLIELGNGWRYPIHASGDVETMGFRDKVYWLHKTRSPIRNARRGSGLEAFFREQEPPSLPAGFAAEAHISVSAAGDLSPHTYLSGSPSALYGEVCDLIFDADVCTANLECCVVPSTGREIRFTTRSGPSFGVTVGELDVLTGHPDRRFSFLSTANNHSLDFGATGVDSTIERLTDAGIAFHGTNRRDDDPTRATIIDRGGIRIGMISVTFGLNGHARPRDRPQIVNRANLNDGSGEVDTSLIEALIAQCRKGTADFVLAHLHWGLEHEFYPTPDQVSFAHHVAELGIDAIVGHHPHVVQPVEFYRTERDPHRVVPIFYSLGNLVNPFSAPYLCTGGIARFVLAKGIGSGGARRTYVEEAEVRGVQQVLDVAARRLLLRPIGVPYPIR